jgi:hypothetical protein
LVVTEVTKFRQVKDWSFLDDLIIVIVENFNDSLSDEIHLLNVTFVADYNSTWSVKSAEHIDDKFISKASLAFVKEMVERFFKFLENSSILNQLCLHLWCDLLIEREFFNDQVEIIFECLFNVLSDIVIQSRLDMEGLV